VTLGMIVVANSLVEDSTMAQGDTCKSEFAIPTFRNAVEETVGDIGRVVMKIDGSREDVDEKAAGLPTTWTGS